MFSLNCSSSDGQAFLVADAYFFEVPKRLTYADVPLTALLHCFSGQG